MKSGAVSILGISYREACNRFVKKNDSDIDPIMEIVKVASTCGSLGSPVISKFRFLGEFDHVFIVFLIGFDVI